MPRVNTVQKARKAQPHNGIEVGDKYYWWKFNFGPRVCSKTYPRRSQLTQSGFLSELYDIQDSISKRFSESTWETIEDDVEELQSEVEGLMDQCQESLLNMPEALQETSDSGITLQDRISALEGWVAELDAIDFDKDQHHVDLSSIIEELTSIEPGI